LGDLVHGQLGGLEQPSRLDRALLLHVRPTLLLQKNQPRRPRYAKTNGLDQTTALQVGMAEKSAEFLDEGARVYLPIDELTQGSRVRRRGAEEPAWGGLAGLLLVAGTVCPDGSGHPDGRVPVDARVSAS
jgi:hypothetical protein